MRPSEMDALVEQGIDALKAALSSGSLSAQETTEVQRAIAKIEAASVETPAEEPEVVEAAKDSEPEPKVEPAKARRIIPRRSAGRKG